MDKKKIFRVVGTVAIVIGGAALYLGGASESTTTALLGGVFLTAAIIATLVTG